MSLTQRRKGARNKLKDATKDSAISADRAVLIASSGRWRFSVFLCASALCVRSFCHCRPPSCGYWRFSVPFCSGHRFRRWIGGRWLGSLRFRGCCLFAATDSAADGPTRCSAWRALPSGWACCTSCGFPTGPPVSAGSRLSFYFAFYLPVFVGLSRVAVHRLRVPVILAAPIVWTGLELARGHL